MSKNSILDTFKELYLNELDMREKIFSRLQLNFAAYVTLTTIISYMLRKVEISSTNLTTYTLLTLFAFFLFLIIGFSLFLLSLYFTIRAFTGYEYLKFPSALKSLDYVKSARKYEQDINIYIENYTPNATKFSSDEMIDDYILESYSKCIEKNLSINETRMSKNRQSLMFLFFSAIMISISSVLFISFDLDTSSSRKTTQTEDANVSKNLKNIEEAIKNYISLSTAKGQ